MVVIPGPVGNAHHFFSSSTYTRAYLHIRKCSLAVCTPAGLGQTDRCVSWWTCQYQARCRWCPRWRQSPPPQGAWWMSGGSASSGELGLQGTWQLKRSRQTKQKREQNYSEKQNIQQPNNNRLKENSNNEMTEKNIHFTEIKQTKCYRLIQTKPNTHTCKHTHTHKKIFLKTFPSYKWILD